MARTFYELVAAASRPAASCNWCSSAGVLPAAGASRCTTVSIVRSKFTCRVTPSSQAGPLYFLVPRKCGVFGFCSEGLPRQVNFLIDEAHLISKGSDAVVSYLHYFFECFGLGETTANLHCDNCAGQNKNRFVLWYLAWRVAIGLHRSITLNFLVVGHTKFAPDACFGLLKRAFKRHAVSSLSEFESVVNGSACLNSSQLVGKEDGTSIVPVSNWQEHLRPHFKALPGIKKYFHFRYTQFYL